LRSIEQIIANTPYYETLSFLSIDKENIFLIHIESLKIFFSWKLNKTVNTIHTPVAGDPPVVDVMLIMTIVPVGTGKTGGKSTCGETFDGRIMPPVLGVVVVSDAASVDVDGVVDVVVVDDGISDENGCELVLFGYTNTTTNCSTLVG